VVKIQVSQDVRHVDMTLRLEPRTKQALRDGAKFWLIGAQPSLTDLSSLSAVVSGVSIGCSPGSGAPQRHFVGLDAPPPVPPGEAGTLYVLVGQEIGGVRVGAGVYYHGLEVGRITRSDLADSQTFRLNAFVSAPYDRLVKARSVFVSVKALEIKLGAASMGARLGPGNSPLVGGVEFDTPIANAADPQSRAGAAFAVFADERQAAAAPQGPQVLYQAAFADGGGELEVDAPVELDGFVVGRVLDRRLTVGADGAATATVELGVDLAKLGLPAGTKDPRVAAAAALDGLVRRGYRLEIQQQPPIIGGAGLVLVQVAGNRKAGCKDGRLPCLPTATAASLRGVAEKADLALDQLDQAPIAAIGQNVRHITARLDQLVSSPELSDSLVRLDHTLTSLDQMASQVRPEVKPLVAKLEAAADQIQAAAASANRLASGAGAPQDANLPDAIRQLTDAARSVRSLADTLDRNPEAVLKGRRIEP
jgi:paraquat-inducible protein B